MPHPKHSRILAADATEPRQRNRGEWTGKKRGAKRGFALHVMADAQTMRMVAPSVTDESVGDVTEFRSLPGPGIDVVGARGGSGDAVHHSKDTGPDAPAREQDCALPSRMSKPPRVGHPASRTAPSDHPDNGGTGGVRYRVQRCRIRLKVQRSRVHR